VRSTLPERRHCKRYLTLKNAAITGIVIDVLLLDLMMPHDGGLTVLRNLRDHHQSLLGKVILLTGSGSGITDPCPTSCLPLSTSHMKDQRS